MPIPRHKVIDMSFVVEINGKKHTFQKAENLRLYVIAHGNKKTKGYVYRGDSNLPLDAFGLMFYDKKWKVSTERGDIYGVDPLTGNIIYDNPYIIRTRINGKYIAVSAKATLNEAINGAVTQYARNYKTSNPIVTVSKENTLLGTIGAIDNYPVFKDAKTKKIKDIYTDGSLHPHIDKSRPVDPTKFKYVVYGLNNKKLRTSTITAKSWDRAVGKIIRSVGMRSSAHEILVFNTNNDVIHTLTYTERLIEPWGYQWTEDGRRDDSTTRNFFIRDSDKKVYFTYGFSKVAHLLNPPKKR